MMRSILSALSRVRARFVVTTVGAIFAAAIPVFAGAQARGAAPATTEACQLLTKSDAAAALGENVTGPRPAGRSGESSACEYSGSGLHKVNLNVMHLTSDMSSMYKALCAQKTKDGLDGLGDTACWYSPAHRELQVLKGTTFFSIEIARDGDPSKAAVALAQKIYGQLK